MAAKRHERTYGRKQAIQLLYQAEILDMAPETLLKDDSNFVDGVAPSSYARMLVNGVKEQLDPIDDLIDECSDNWALDRMPAVDRAVLRLAVYEMIHVDDVPVAVAINEAVDLAREYGGEDESPRFVNGVLGRIARRIDADGAPAEDEEFIDAADSSDAEPATSASPVEAVAFEGEETPAETCAGSCDSFEEGND